MSGIDWLQICCVINLRVAEFEVVGATHNDDPATMFRQIFDLDALDRIDAEVSRSRKVLVP